LDSDVLTRVQTPATSVEPNSGIRFYTRIFSYFRQDRRLLAALVLFIWVALGLGVLEPAAVAVLTDTVLPGR
jgi:ABC-type bacteriocin/lantibiotic exporter with double-glycine peptidase domain